MGVRELLPAESPGNYFIGRIRGGDVAAVGSIPEGLPQMATWNTYVWVDSADETAAKVTAAGGNVLMEPFDVMESGRMAVFADPEGAMFCVWQAKEHKGSQIVNEHGSVNFNDLHTRDAGRRRILLRLGVRLGEARLPGGFGMWTLPGYGDLLEHANPGLGEIMAETGAPRGS